MCLRSYQHLCEKRGYVAHQALSFDAYLKFVEDDFLGGERLNPRSDGRPDPRPFVRENVPMSPTNSFGVLRGRAADGEGE